MSDFVIKLTGPQHSMELQVPVGSGTNVANAMHAVKNLLEPEVVEEPKRKFRKAKKKGQSSDTAKQGITTAGMLLASLIMSAMSDN